MPKVLQMFAVLGIVTAPAVAQTSAPAQPAPAETAKTVTKIVCERVRSSETGTRVGPRQKVCKKVQVAAPAEAGKKAAPQGQADPQGQAGN